MESESIIIKDIDYEPRFSFFRRIMQKRIHKILLVSNLYDRFLLEEDGRLGDRLIETYQEFGLSSPPEITGVSTPEKAFQILKEQKIDLVFTMQRIGVLNPYKFGRKVKALSPTPVVLLLNNSAELRRLPPRKERIGIDKIFFWYGDPKLFLVIIKLFEDKINIKFDAKYDIQLILAISQSIRYYSTFLPMLYSEVIKQTQRLIEIDTLNEYHRLLRMRARPKIIIVDNYESAMKYFNQYKHNIIAIISDVAFPRTKLEDEPDLLAGTKFIKGVKKYDPMLPTLLMSSYLKNLEKAEKINASFIYKHSPKALHFLRKFILDYLGFGDFIFRLPNGLVVGRARNLEELKNQLKVVPEESIAHLVKGNSFSKWFLARSFFKIAYKIRPLTLDDFNSIDHLRNFLIDTIDQLEQDTQIGAIVDFDSSLYGTLTLFARMSGGSLGGKGRGIAFLHNLLSRSNLNQKYPKIQIQIPHTVGVCTDEFDTF